MRALWLLMIGCVLGAAVQAQPLGRLAGIAVIDRETGAVLSPHYYRGEYWIAGRPGAKYSIEIQNRLGERLLAVTSVDGVNVISGETAAWDQSGYVFEPGQRYEVNGWRKSDAEVAAFTFTESPRSYAERTGRPENVGVIGVALFRERRPAVSPRLSEERPTHRSDAPPAPEAAAPFAAAPRAEAAPKLGTGHGEREYSYVDHTDFVRLQPQPNEVIRIRYDSLDNLLAMGVIRRERLEPPGVNPFPATPTVGYVPDPSG
jgi:hypothetical protein